MFPQVHTEVLWTGNKSCKQNHERIGFWVMPPCVAFDNVPGHAFARTPDRNVFFILDQERIVRLQITPRKHTVFPSLGSVGGSCAGIVVQQGKVYTFVMRSKDQLIVLTDSGDLLERYPLRGKQGNPRPLLGKRIGTNGPVYPFRTLLTPSRSLLVLEPDMWQQLCEYTLSGVLKREWKGVTGCAVSRTGKVYVSGHPQPCSDVTLVVPPHGLKTDAWQLVGIDDRDRLYWRTYVIQAIPIKPPSRQSWTWAFNRLACGSLDGQLFWEIELDGPAGVLARYDPYLHASGGAGGGWIEIEPEGSILVFGVSRSEKVINGVGLYKVWVSADRG
jgi:hypothetical protein